jgi:hypothetical protein
MMATGKKSVAAGFWEPSDGQTAMMFMSSTEAMQGLNTV